MQRGPPWPGPELPRWRLSIDAGRSLPQFDSFHIVIEFFIFVFVDAPPEAEIRVASFCR